MPAYMTLTAHQECRYRTALRELLFAIEQHIGITIERALQNLLPPGSLLPFAVRLTAEVLAADGSIVENAINSSVLALRSANISLSRPAAGS